MIGGLFARAGVRGVLLRPDRYVAAALPETSGPEELGRLLAALEAQTQREGADAPVVQRLDLAHADAGTP